MTAGKVARRIATALAMIVLAVLVPAGCGGGGGSPEAIAGRGGPAVDRDVVHRHPRTSPAVARLQRALVRSLRAAGTSTGASVLDLTTGTQLFSLRAGVRRPPASVEKLYTTFVLLRLLGPHAQLHTRVMATGHLSRGGVWHGNLYLRGGGDPTFGDRAFQRVWYLGYGASVTDLAGQLAAAGIRRVSGRVIADASLFDAGRGGPASGLAADIPDFGGQLSALTFDHGATQGMLSPEAFAARQLVRTMRAMGIRARSAPGAAGAPRGARRLAEVSSPPLPVLLDLMNVPSDDLFAEMLTKRLGARFHGDGTIAAGAGVIEDAVKQLGVHPRIVDGSGLSRRDASSPAQVVTLLQAGLAHRHGAHAGGLAAGGGPDRDGAAHRRRNRRPGPLRGQDRHARRGHQPGRPLPQPPRACDRLCRVCRRSEQRVGAAVAQPCSGGDRPVPVAVS